MYYIATYRDRPDAGEARQKFRPEHAAYRISLGTRLLTAGPLLGPDGKTSIGSLLVFEASDQAAAEAFAGGDPLVREGALDLVSVIGFIPRAFNAPTLTPPGH